MSHEIRTPMNGIIGMSEILLESDLDDEQSENINIISDSANKLLKIINDILDFSKMEAGKIELVYQPFNLRNLVYGVKQILSPKALEKNIRIKTDFDSDTPEILIGDEIRLRQVIMNIAGNSIKLKQIRRRFKIYCFDTFQI